LRKQVSINNKKNNKKNNTEKNSNFLQLQAT
jgi:hypothetical protein